MEDGWTSWSGGECPVPFGAKTEMIHRDGTYTETEAPETWDWEDDGVEGDIVKYRVLGESGATQQCHLAVTKTVSDGGSSDYYKLTIKNKAGEEIQCEMGDIIRCVYGDNFSLGNIAKAARRMYEASQGRGKEGASIAYDANKVRYFASEFERWNKDKHVAN